MMQQIVGVFSPAQLKDMLINLDHFPTNWGEHERHNLKPPGIGWQEYFPNATPTPPQKKE